MSEITKTDAASQPFAVPSWVWIVFVALALFVFFSGLTVPLMGPDEPRYAEVAREMWQSGDWLTPTLGGYPWFEKPPLLYWLDIASFNSFGVSEFAARLGPVLCGLGTVGALWMLAKAEDRRERTGSANWHAVIAASTLGFIVFSHAAGFDIVVTFPLTAALVSFFIFDRSIGSLFKQKHLPLLLFYAFVGIAILAKGLIGIMFPFAVVGLYYLLSRRWPVRAFMIGLLWGLPVILLIAAPWHLVMYQRYGSEFIAVYFVQNHFERFTTNKYLHPQPFYFFFWVLPVMMLPWTPFFLAAMWAAVRGIFHRVSTPLVRFSISWLAVPLVFFSFSGSKLPGYIVPAVPAAVIITAVFTVGLVRKSSKWLYAVLGTAAITLGIAAVLLVFALPDFAERDSVKALIQAADEKGYTSTRILVLHMISYNAEYYGSGRLLRNANGSQRRLEGTQLVSDEIKKDGRPVLVLVPLEYLQQLTDYDKVTTTVIKDNGEIAIAAVSAR